MEGRSQKETRMGTTDCFLLERLIQQSDKLDNILIKRQYDFIFLIICMILKQVLLEIVLGKKIQAKSVVYLA